LSAARSALRKRCADASKGKNVDVLALVVGDAGLAGLDVHAELIADRVAGRLGPRLRADRIVTGHGLAVPAVPVVLVQPPDLVPLVGGRGRTTVIIERPARPGCLRKRGQLARPLHRSSAVEVGLIGLDEVEESGLFHVVLLTLFDRCAWSMAGALDCSTGWAFNPEECLAGPWSRDEERGSALRSRYACGLHGRVPCRAIMGDRRRHQGDHAGAPAAGAQRLPQGHASGRRRPHTRKGVGPSKIVTA